VSYVDAGYSIALGVLFLYAVALVLRRRRWERAMRVAEQTAHAEQTEHRAHVEHQAHTEHAEHAEHAEEQTAPGARS
jgi:ABC-type nickel/cobalt efflux system permease component RcnA